MTSRYVEVDGELNIEFDDVTFDPDSFVDITFEPNGYVDVHNAPQVITRDDDIPSLTLLFENGLI